MKIPMFPCKYHQNGGFSMAMLVLGRVCSMLIFRGVPLGHLHSSKSFMAWNRRIQMANAETSNPMESERQIVSALGGFFLKKFLRLRKLVPESLLKSNKCWSWSLKIIQRPWNVWCVSRNLSDFFENSSDSEGTLLIPQKINRVVSDW